MVWYRFSLYSVPYPYHIPYTGVIEEHDVLEQVSVIAKTIHFVNLTHYTPKRTDIGANLAYLYGTSTSMAIKIGFQTTNSMSMGLYIRYPYPLYVQVQWASLIQNVTTGSKEKDNQAGLNSQPRSSVTTQNHKTTTSMNMYNMKMIITCHICM